VSSPVVDLLLVPALLPALARTRGPQGVAQDAIGASRMSAPVPHLGDADPPGRDRVDQPAAD
jgi:hypothetical protein